MVIFKLLCDPSLDGIIGHRFCEQLTRELQHCQNLGTRLPFVGPKHAQAHASLVIVGHIGMVDLRFEGDGRGFEGVFGGKGQVKLEFAVLRTTELCVSEGS